MITFERATPADAQILVDLKIRAFAEDAALYGSGPPEYDSVECTRRYIETALSYKIMSEEKAIGGFVLFDLGQDHMVLGSIFIDPVCHNQGIGSRAIAFMEAAHPHIRKWTLETPYKSYRNHHFYEKNGYVKIGRTQPEEPNGFYLFLYEKHIPLNS